MKNSKKFSLISAWCGMGVDFGEASDKMRRFMLEFRRVYPGFHILEGVTDDFIGLREDWSDLQRHLEEMAKPDRHVQQHFSHLDEHGKVTSKTASQFAFDFSFVVYDSADREQRIWLRAHLGGYGSNSLVVDFSGVASEVLTLELTRRLLDVVIDIWNPTQASFSSPVFTSAYSDGKVSRSLITTGWLTYLRNPLLSNCLPNGLPCEVQRFANGGVLFTLSPNLPDENSSESLTKARALQGFFDQLHFDHVYVLEGWPQDEAEDDYANQVTGAPRDRKYVVAFCAFDSYDAERKVLIYARLFRVSVGAIARKNVVQDPIRMEGLPFLVQARHQIAAVEYAGARTPIEWHVGIESNARDLTTLLNGIAGIPVEKLKVVYTPYNL